jgi:hypothetical protein
MALDAGSSPSAAVVAQSPRGRAHDAARDDAARCDVARSAKSGAVGTHSPAAPERCFGASSDVDGVCFDPSIRHGVSGPDYVL